MKAIILAEAGGVHNLKYVDFPKPIINENEILIKVQAISINPVDCKVRTNEDLISWFFGKDRPVILGWDLSGTVEEAGKNVTTFKVTDEVFGMVNFPGKGNVYAEYVAAPSSHLTLKPGNISHGEAAAATLAALTAWQALVTNGHVKGGDKVLIHGASGGVGHFAVQIARYLGAFVIGTSSAKNAAFVLQNGADKHIDYTKVAFENEITDVDFVLVTIGGDTVARSISVTREGGKIITIAGGMSEENSATAKSKSVDLSAMMVQSSGDDMKIIAELMQKGSIKAHVSRKFSFKEIDKAHLQLESGHTVGRVVVSI